MLIIKIIYINHKCILFEKPKHFKIHKTFHLAEIYG